MASDCEIWNKYSIACSKGDINSIHYLISNGFINVNSVDSKGRTGLLIAAGSTQVQVVKYLLSNGADPTLKDINNNTPLHLASIIGSSEIVSTILNFQNQQLQQQLIENNNNNNNNSNLLNQTILSKDVNNNTPINLASSRLKRMLTNIKSKSSSNNTTSELINELKSILSHFYSIINSIGTDQDKLKMQAIINNFENINTNNDQESFEMDEDYDNNINSTSSTLTKTIDDLDSLLNGLSLG